MNKGRCSVWKRVEERNWYDKIGRSSELRPVTLSRSQRDDRAWWDSLSENMKHNILLSDPKEARRLVRALKW